MSKTAPSRPVPVLQNENSFSRKKKKISRFEFNETPLSPVKSAPPVSRVFNRKENGMPGVCTVSFNKSLNKSLESPLYTNFDKLYFDQCFTRLSFLGTGSFGHVVKVQSREDGMLYAIKKSRQRFRNDHDRSIQLEEVNKNEQIAIHRNCVRFYKAWEECDYLYIQSELCEMSLKDYTESVQVISEKEIWYMINNLCLGLKHLHDAGLVHMDIKPANLFLGRDGFYKIGDFGLVVELARDLSDAMDGDSKYLAPELMEEKVSKAVDIFSLGITLLELACSLELPNGGSLWHKLRTNKLPLEFTQGLSDDLIILISSMMDRNPKNRPTVGEIIKRPCVIQACRGGLVGKSDELQLHHFIIQPLIFVLQFFIKLFAGIFIPKMTYFKDFRHCNDSPSRDSISHRSVRNICSSMSTPSNLHLRCSPLATGVEVVPLSPVLGDGESVYFKPISNKIDKEIEGWTLEYSPEVISPTPQSYCSTPRLDCVTPPSASTMSRESQSSAENLLSVRLFGDDDIEDNKYMEDTLDSPSLSMNLLNAFESKTE